MEQIQNLITQVQIVNNKNNELLDATCGRFNIFKIVGVNHYENTHSSILAEFLNPLGSHGLKDGFLKKFIETVGIKIYNGIFDTATAKVLTEATIDDGNGRIDILITDKNSKAIIIENKIYAQDQYEQLKRYNEFASGKFGNGNYQILYLTLDGHHAEKHSGGDVQYTPVSYKDLIIPWLKECQILAINHPIIRETLSQYINHLKGLTGQNMAEKLQEELLNIMTKSENVESLCLINDNFIEAKRKIITDFANKIVKAEELREEHLIPKCSGASISFRNETWKEQVAIYFGALNFTYYSIRTKETEKTAPLQKINDLFDMDPDPWTPYGYKVIHNDFLREPKMLTKMADSTDSSLASEIIDVIQKLLSYIKLHPELVK